jgi:hypothetical protein
MKIQSLVISYILIAELVTNIQNDTQFDNNVTKYLNSVIK